MAMRQAMIAGVDCLAMMEEHREQVKRQDGSIEEVYSWEGQCRVPAPQNQRFVSASVDLQAVSYRGPLKRESGRVDEVEGEVVVRPLAGSGGMVRTGTAEHIEASNTSQDVFELEGTGEPSVVERD